MQVVPAPVTELKSAKKGIRNVTYSDIWFSDNNVFWWSNWSGFHCSQCLGKRGAEQSPEKAFSAKKLKKEEKVVPKKEEVKNTIKAPPPKKKPESSSSDDSSSESEEEVLFYLVLLCTCIFHSIWFLILHLN